MIKKKTQKPIEIDVHFKYRCTKCSVDHWISLNQAKTKNYKIVCDCGGVFKPKTIKKISILYKETKKEQGKRPTESQNQSVLDSEVLNKCANVLVNYGFTQTESIELLQKSYHKYKTNNSADLIKLVLQSIGAKHE